MYGGVEGRDVGNMGYGLLLAIAVSAIPPFAMERV
jgi:hypothetical protein